MKIGVSYVPVNFKLVTKRVLCGSIADATCPVCHTPSYDEFCGYYDYIIKIAHQIIDQGNAISRSDNDVLVKGLGSSRGARL